VRNPLSETINDQLPRGYVCTVDDVRQAKTENFADLVADAYLYSLLDDSRQAMTITVDVFQRRKASLIQQVDITVGNLAGMQVDAAKYAEELGVSTTVMPVLHREQARVPPAGALFTDITKALTNLFVEAQKVGAEAEDISPLYLRDNMKGFLNGCEQIEKYYLFPNTPPSGVQYFHNFKDFYGGLVDICNNSNAAQMDMVLMQQYSGFIIDFRNNYWDALSLGDLKPR